VRMLNGQMEVFCHGDPRRAALVVLRATIYPSLTHRVSTKTMPIKGQFMQRRALKDKSGTFSGNRFNGTPLCLPHLASGRMTCKKLLDIYHISDTFQHRKLPETPSPSPMIVLALSKLLPPEVFKSHRSKPQILRIAKGVSYDGWRRAR
jgi:hypothetical protein